MSHDDLKIFIESLNKAIHHCYNNIWQFRVNSEDWLFWNGEITRLYAAKIVANEILGE